MRLYICAFENCLFAQRYNSLTLNIICWAAQARVYSLRQGCGCVSFARENRLLYIRARRDFSRGNIWLACGAVIFLRENREMFLADFR